MRYLTVLLITMLAAGCASAPSATDTSSTYITENQEEQIQRLLVGIWEGYVNPNRGAIYNRDRILVIDRVYKWQNSWVINASLNQESLEYIKLEVYNNTVKLEMMDHYGGSYKLGLYQNTHLLGSVIYDRGFWIGDPNAVVLQKVRYRSH